MAGRNNLLREEMAVFDIKIDWHNIAENLRSEHLIDFFMRRDPVELVTNPWVIVPVLSVLVALYFLNFRKLIAVFVGLCGMWAGFYYGMPYEGDELDLHNVLVIGGAFVGVAALWIYVFLIRND